MSEQAPIYLARHASGELARRTAQALHRLAACDLCPRLCGVDRLHGELGFCGVGRHARVASHTLHFGEEAPLVGEGGSGTIFFSGCNLGCVFCQNDDISHDSTSGKEMDAAQLATIMLDLQARGAHNINVVTPSHVAAQLLEALVLAVNNGLHLPLVFNTSSYDRVSTLALFEDVVDIYMPDAKFWDDASAGTYCDALSYPDRARSAIREMYRQVGDLVVDGKGLARHGLLVRHLVLPEDRACTQSWMHWLATEVSDRTYVNIMDQYHPCGKAETLPPLDRPITPEEFQFALEAAEAAGINRLDNRHQGMARHIWRALLQR